MTKAQQRLFFTIVRDLYAERKSLEKHHATAKRLRDATRPAPPDWKFRVRQEVKLMDACIVRMQEQSERLSSMGWGLASASARGEIRSAIMLRNSVSQGIDG